MIETKLFEVRDRMTFIPVMATWIKGGKPGTGDASDYLCRRAGYGETGCVLLVSLRGGSARYDPYEWPAADQRTMANAHHYIEAHWHELSSGDVVDVEFALGERPTPKISERIEAGIG